MRRTLKVNSECSCKGLQYSECQVTIGLQGVRCRAGSHRGMYACWFTICRLLPLQCAMAPSTPGLAPQINPKAGRPRPADCVSRLIGVCRDALQLGTALDRALTEKGVLQLLLDVRFMRDALAGGRPAPPGGGPQGPPAGDIAADLAARKRAHADLEASLQARCPIPYFRYGILNVHHEWYQTCRA